MSKGVTYITGKKSITEISQENKSRAEISNIDLYEIIAGIYEEILVLSKENARLNEVIQDIIECEGAHD